MFRKARTSPSLAIYSAEIARAVVREAYRAGAKHVLLLYGDLHLRKAAITSGPRKSRWSAPLHLLDLYHRAYDERPAPSR